MAASDPRIGTYNEDGTRVWPEVTVEGQPYLRPINEARLNKRHFVVFSVNGITEEQRRELLALVEPSESAPVAEAPIEIGPPEEAPTKKGRRE